MKAKKTEQKITQRRTKIVATLGPSTDDVTVLENLIRAGVDVLRLNFSHGAADALVPGHIVKQFEMVDVHREKNPAAAKIATRPSAEQPWRCRRLFAFATGGRRGSLPPQ